MTDWKNRKIKELGRVVTGKTPPTGRSEYFENGTDLFISPKDLSWDSLYIRRTETRITQKALEKFKNQVLPKNSILFTSLSFGFGKMGITSRVSLTNQQINSIIVNNNNHFRFVYYLLKVNTSLLFSYNSGIDTPIVPKSVFENVRVFCPELDLQRKIAAVLSAYDDLIENNKRRIAILEKMAEEFYREWFVRMRFPGHETTKFEKGVPECWITVPFSSLCVFQKGKDPKELLDSQTEGTVAYLNVDSVESKQPSFVMPRKGAIFAASDDVLMLMDGARSGLVFRGFDGVVGSTFAKVETTDIMKNFIFEYLKAGKEAIVSNNTGSAIPHANKEFIKRMLLRLPSDKRLTEHFNGIYEPLRTQILLLRECLTNMARTRDLLLPRLISGKLSVEDLDIRFPPSMVEEEQSEPEAAYA